MWMGTEALRRSTHLGGGRDCSELLRQLGQEKTRRLHDMEVLHCCLPLCCLLQQLQLQKLQLSKL